MMNKNLPDTFLTSMGWNSFFQSNFDKMTEPGLLPARIVSQGRGHYYIQISAEEILEAVITSQLHAVAKTSGDFPTVGDWVAFGLGHGRDKANIHHVLERSSSLHRKRSGKADKIQHLAANAEAMMIVTSLNEDFDIARLGRYVSLSKDSGADVHFILTKTDLCENPNEYIQKLSAEFPGIDSYLITSKDSTSMDVLRKFFTLGKTAVLLGSSGVGKSTLTNYLSGQDLQKTGALAIESRGRHTTTSRNLLFTRWGGMVIDTPGMQEILATDSDEGRVDFSDIDNLALRCKFTTCRHQNDPGCAIQAGLKDGTLSADHWAGYLKAASKRPPPAKKRWEK